MPSQCSQSPPELQRSCSFACLQANVRFDSNSRPTISLGISLIRESCSLSHFSFSVPPVCPEKSGVFEFSETSRRQMISRLRKAYLQNFSQVFPRSPRKAIADVGNFPTTWTNIMSDSNLCYDPTITWVVLYPACRSGQLIEECVTRLKLGVHSGRFSFHWSTL